MDHAEKIKTKSHAMQRYHYQGEYPLPGGPKISFDMGNAMIIVSGLMSAVSFVHLNGMTFGTTSIISSVAFSSFSFATTLFIASSSRISSEIMQEYGTYVIPNKKKSFVWHYCWISATISFYIGLASWFGTSAWTLADSHRDGAAVVIAGMGLCVLALGIIVHIKLLYTPLGEITPVDVGDYVDRSEEEMRNLYTSQEEPVMMDPLQKPSPMNLKTPTRSITPEETIRQRASSAFEEGYPISMPRIVKEGKMGAVYSVQEPVRTSFPTTGAWDN